MQTPGLSRSADSGQCRPATPHTPEEILSHPQFVAARTAYIEGLLGLYDNNRFMNRLLIEATRSIVFFTALVIYAGYDAADRTTWPTIGLLKQTIEPYGLSTARRVDGLISQFVDTGYLTLSTPAGSVVASVVFAFASPPGSVRRVWSSSQLAGS